MAFFLYAFFVIIVWQQSEFAFLVAAASVAALFNFM